MATTDPTINNAIDAVAKKLNISREDALKVVVGQGMQQLSARAFTLGNDLAFGSQPAPGQGLTAHEATHVIQQATGRINTPQR
jgi:hypothetical protein